MNETGSYPGQPWLWLYSLWYQVEPIEVIGRTPTFQVLLIMGLLTWPSSAYPSSPASNILPRKIPIYKLIWREHYRAEQST